MDEDDYENENENNSENENENVERPVREEFDVYGRTAGVQNEIERYSSMKTDLQKLYNNIVYKQKDYKKGFKELFVLILKIVADVLFDNQKEVDNERVRFISEIPADFDVLTKHLDEFGNIESLNPVLFLIGYDLAENSFDPEDTYNTIKSMWSDIPYKNISLYGVIRYYRRWNQILENDSDSRNII